MINRTITKQGIEKILKIKRLMKNTLNEMNNLKVTDVGSDWIMFCLVLSPCYEEIGKVIRFINDYLYLDDSN